MVTRQWVAVHRKHHAKVETPEDPHSPQIHGIGRLLSAGVFLYVSEARDRETLERFGYGTPHDWIETQLYARWSFFGPVLMALIDVVAFGMVAASLIFAVQMIWIPFWAAINGIGHYWGYRNYPVEDASTNILPCGILIGGEEFHNNHHAGCTSDCLRSWASRASEGLHPCHVSAPGRRSATRILCRPSSRTATTCLRNTPARLAPHVGRRPSIR